MRSQSSALILAALTVTFAGFAQQQPSADKEKQKRDLIIEKDTPAAVPPKPGPVAIPRSYALVVGIAKYKNLDPKHQLKYPDRDAESIYSILISPEGGNFKAENVHKLIGEKATLANLRRELEEWLPGIAKDQDRVLIYFAGHGFVNPTDKKAYLAPYDIDMKNITGTGYPMDSLGTAIGSKIKGKSKVLLTDSCHSGAITPVSDPQKVNESLLNLNRSLFSLTASRDRESSYESPEWGGGHGIFTYYVVKGLEGHADENRDGVVNADELAEYVRTNVREATKGAPLGPQNPTSDRGSFDPNMLLAYNPSRIGDGPPQPKTGTLIIEANMDGVEIFVDGKSVGVVNKGKALTLPGYGPGGHTIQGVRMGYEPDGPREEIVYPGQEVTVSIKILIPRRRNKAALDALDDGLKYYNKGYAQNYRKAAEHFQKALSIDPTYSQAALYLGRTYNALFQQEQAEKYFREAIRIDPDYLEARASFGGMLMDIGNVDEAIRQFNTVVQRDKNHALALTLLAEAYRLKQLYPESIESAQKAIRLTPTNAEPHFWLAESLRLSKNYQKANAEYEEYLRLSDFDTKLAGQLNYYLAGFLLGHGRKKRAAQQDIWKDLRSMAYFGLCDGERKLSRFDSAINYCQKSLAYAQDDDAYIHFALALAFAHKGNDTGSVEYFSAARKHFRAMLDINSAMEEAEMAKGNIASIDKVLQSQP